VSKETALAVGVVAAVLLFLHNLPVLLVGGAICYGVFLLEEWLR
jgi:hypothetical protein